jgi:hypothetical protein
LMVRQIIFFMFILPELFPRLALGRCAYGTDFP